MPIRDRQPVDIWTVSGHGICASHDLCDANQAMIDALGRFNVEYDSQDEAQGKLIDAAWSLAKAQGFGTPKE